MIASGRQFQRSITKGIAAITYVFPIYDQSFVKINQGINRSRELKFHTQLVLNRWMLDIDSYSDKQKCKHVIIEIYAKRFFTLSASKIR